MPDHNRLEFRALLSSGLHPMSMMAGSLLLSMALCLLLAPLCREYPRVLFWDLLFTLYSQPLFRCNFWSWVLLSQVCWWYGSLTKCTIWWTLFCPAKHLDIHWWYSVMDDLMLNADKTEVMAAGASPCLRLVKKFYLADISRSNIPFKMSAEYLRVQTD